MAQAERIGSDTSRMTEHAILKEHPSAQYKANVKNGVWQKSLRLRGKVAITKPVGEAKGDRGAS